MVYGAVRPQIIVDNKSYNSEYTLDLSSVLSPLFSTVYHKIILLQVKNAKKILIKCNSFSNYHDLSALRVDWQQKKLKILLVYKSHISYLR